MMILPIKSWNVLMLNSDPNDRKPSVNVKLTDDLAKVLVERGNNFIVRVYGTGTVYDTDDGNKVYDGTAYSTLNTPDYRPNFFMKNKDIVFVLDQIWYGYPDPRKLGYISIQ